MPEGAQESDDREMVKYGDLACTKCGSHDTDDAGDEIIHGRTYKKMTCRACGHGWTAPKQ